MKMHTKMASIGVVCPSQLRSTQQKSGLEFKSCELDMSQTHLREFSTLIDGSACCKELDGRQQSAVEWNILVEMSVSLWRAECMLHHWGFARHWQMVPFQSFEKAALHFASHLLPPGLSYSLLQLCFLFSVCVFQQTEGFKKRWFTLDHRRLMYFKDPLVSGTHMHTQMDSHIHTHTP